MATTTSVIWSLWKGLDCRGWSLCSTRLVRAFDGGRRRCVSATNSCLFFSSYNENENGSDGRACITLDLAPLTVRALEEGQVQSTGAVVTISLSLSQRARGEHVSLGDWLASLRRCCQYTLCAMSSLTTTNALVDRARAASDTDAQKPVLSILAAGLPFPKSPSMQIEESERGLASDAERQEREERGWWSKRFHEVFSELSKQEAVAWRTTTAREGETMTI